MIKIERINILSTGTSTYGLWRVTYKGTILFQRYGTKESIIAYCKELFPHANCYVED